MKTYPNPEITREIMIADMIAHREADELITGTYGGETSDGKFRGCAVGCSIHTINRLRGTRHSHGDHAALAAEIGAPVALFRLQDCVFEGLADDPRADWPRRFYTALPEGVDVSASAPRILVRILREVALPAVTVDKWGVRDAIEGVCVALKTGEALHAAADAAADACARAAAGVSDAARTAYAAGAAAEAAGVSDAAEAAVYAAGATGAARAAYAKIADIICEELERCARAALQEPSQ